MISLFHSWVPQKATMTLNFLAVSSSGLPAFIATFQKSKFEKASELILFLTYDCFLFLKCLWKFFPGQYT